MSTVLGQRSHCGTVLTSLTAMDAVTVMIWECAASQVSIEVVVIRTSIILIFMFSISHRLSRYTGIYPRLSIDNTRRRSLRALSIRLPKGFPMQYIYIYSQRL